MGLLSTVILLALCAAGATEGKVQEGKDGYENGSDLEPDWQFAVFGDFGCLSVLQLAIKELDAIS
jgi:hypothetical protein